MVAGRRLGHGQLDLTALQLAWLGAAGELADDLEPDRVGERPEHRQHVDRVEIRCRRGVGVAHCLTSIEQFMYDRNQTIAQGGGL